MNSTTQRRVSQDAPEYFTWGRVVQMTGLNKAALRARMKKGAFPKPAGYVQTESAYVYECLFLQSDIYEWLRENGTSSERTGKRSATMKATGYQSR